MIERTQNLIYWLGIGLALIGETVMLFWVGSLIPVVMGVMMAGLLVVWFGGPFYLMWKDKHKHTVIQHKELGENE